MVSAAQGILLYFWTLYKTSLLVWKRKVRVSWLLCPWTSPGAAHAGVQGSLLQLQVFPGEAVLPHDGSALCLANPDRSNTFVKSQREFPKLCRGKSASSEPKKVKCHGASLDVASTSVRRPRLIPSCGLSPAQQSSRLYQLLCSALPGRFASRACQ